MIKSNVWIVLVNFNGLDDTCKCLRSLMTLASSVSVVVVDNASRIDPTSVLAQNFPGVRLIRHTSNLGWSGGNNSGIRFALEHGADYILLLNNDTTVHPRLVERLLTAFTLNPTFGIIGPVIRFMDEPESVMTDGVIFNRPKYPGFFQRLPVPEHAADPPPVTEVDIVNGCAMMIRASTFRRVGLIDDRFFLIHEEANFCLRAQHMKIRCGVLAEGLVWHKGSSAFKNTGKRWQRYYDTRNLGLLLAQQYCHARPRRSQLSSYVAYMRYAYHRYCHEREAGHRDAADAVLEGVIDFVTRRYGPYETRRRASLPLFRSALELIRRVKTNRQDEMPVGARRDLWEARGS